MMFSNVDGYIDARAPATQTATTPQGVIGMTLLRSFKVVLDYKHKSITFIQSSRIAAESAACTGTQVPFMPEWHGVPVAKAHTDIGAMDFHVIDYAQLPGTDGFVGNDFFANHVVCMDFPGTRLLVRR